VFSRPAEVSTPNSPSAGGPGTGTPTGGQPGGSGNPATPSTPSRPTACASTAGFRSVGARRRGRGLRITMQRRVAAPVNVDVFQQSRGRRVFRNLLVARFNGKTRSFTWNGRPREAKRVTDGRYFVRFRMPTGAGRRDIRRVTLVRSGGRFRSRPPFYGRNSCGLLTSYKLSSAVFGGLQRRRLGIAFRLSRSARVSVVVRRGSRVVRRYRTRTYRGERTHRLVLSARGLRRGDYRITLRARGGARRAAQRLVARRL
jgi:hypothetical protein